MLSSDSERVIGIYLHPYRIFSDPDWNDPYSATEVITKVKVESKEVLITRNGGLFIQPPSALSDGLKLNAEPGKDFQAKLEFQDKSAHIINRVICDFALHGIVSEPATPVHISLGRLIDNHALITSAGGGREIYLERTIIPSMQLLQGTWRLNPVHSIDVVNVITKQKLSSQLASISESLPTLVASAYSLFSRSQNSEALIDSWIVIEQVIDWLWKNYLGTIAECSRKDRLSDTRTYSAAVRIETLHTTAKIPLPIYEAANAARQHRNNLAHRAKINQGMAMESMFAMKQVIEFICNTTVEPPLTNVGVTW
jgi:hypothetical protein